MSSLPRLLCALLIFATICVGSRSLLETRILRILTSFFVFYGMWLLLFASVLFEVARRKTRPQQQLRVDLVATAICLLTYIAYSALSLARLANP